MKRIFPVLVAASLAASGTALAQTTPNNNDLTTGIAPGNSSGAVTPGTGPNAGQNTGQMGLPHTLGGAAPGTAPGVTPNGTAPTVGNTAVGGGMAPGATPMTNDSQGRANGTTATNTQNGTTTQNGINQAPVPGANSFTMGQARARIQHDGFTQVSGLHKDRRGVWRGKAMKNGQSVNVALDYQGKVFGQ